MWSNVYPSLAFARVLQLAGFIPGVRLIPKKTRGGPRQIGTYPLLRSLFWWLYIYNAQNQK
jgi:hypothetical protein